MSRFDGRHDEGSVAMLPHFPLFTSPFTTHSPFSITTLGEPYEWPYGTHPLVNGRATTVVDEHVLPSHIWQTAFFFTSGTGGTWHLDDALP